MVKRTKYSAKELPEHVVSNIPEEQLGATHGMNDNLNYGSTDEFDSSQASPQTGWMEVLEDSGNSDSSWSLGGVVLGITAARGLFQQYV